MTQRSRALTVLAETQGSVPSAYKLSTTPVPDDTVFSFDLCGHLHTHHAHKLTQAHTHTHE